MELKKEPMSKYSYVINILLGVVTILVGLFFIASFAWNVHIGDVIWSVIVIGIFFLITGSIILRNALKTKK